MRANRVVAIALMLFLLPGLAGAAELSVSGLRFGFGGGGTRIVLDTSAQAPFRAFLLNDPPRLVLDLPPAKWKGPAQGRAGAGSIVRSWRSGRLDEGGLTRVVFDLARPALVTSAFPLPASAMAGNRVVVDLSAASPALFSASLSKLWGQRELGGNTLAATPSVSRTFSTSFRAGKASPPPEEGRKAGKGKRKYVVVIDAGHGGQDPGAESGGLQEKRLTLAMAKELARVLESTGRYDAVLTRDSDRYIKLRERLAFSRRKGGDVFISLHADKMPGDRSVRGTSIYTLSQTASDDETAALAESENQAGVVAGVDLADESADVADILLDLAMREKMNESNVFASAIQRALSAKGVRLLPHAHRSAGFAVLKAPDIPAVLVEMGFLSNPQEARLLDSGAFRASFAGALAEGIDAYFRKMQALRRVE
jgi:N-acetylmuramoyl-L-alanine amidase